MDDTSNTGAGICTTASPTLTVSEGNLREAFTVWNTKRNESPQEFMRGDQADRITASDLGAVQAEYLYKLLSEITQKGH